jgi:hypothetical protein
LKRVFDYVQRLIEELVQALALGVEQLRNDEARAGAFASLLAHDRDTPSCRATAATVMPASKAPRGDDIPFCFSIWRQPWRTAASARAKER